MKSYVLLLYCVLAKAVKSIFLYSAIFPFAKNVFFNFFKNYLELDRSRIREQRSMYVSMRALIRHSHISTFTAVMSVEFVVRIPEGLWLFCLRLRGRAIL